jgi:hypothetical protein
LPDDNINSITIDEDDNPWIGTNSGGVAYFEWTVWTVYDAGNSGLSGNTIYSICIDYYDTKWIGGCGLSVFNEGGIPDKISYMPEDAERANIFPNPAGDFITVELPHEVRHFISLIDVVTVDGKSVMRYPGIKNCLMTLNVSTLPKGVYLIKTYAGNKVYVNKVLIGH